MTPSIRTRAQLVKLSRSSSLPAHTHMPTPVISVSPRPTFMQAWREMFPRTTARLHTRVDVRSYKSDADFQRDARRRLNNGWTLASQTATPGHVKVGKTFFFMILTGGLSLLGGAARTSDKQTATWIRD